MSLFEQFGMMVLRSFDPEKSHKLSIAALRAGLAPLPGLVTSARLKTTFAGMELPNPVGLAAGYDKNAEAIPQLSRAGFGFLELGAATPRPQPGNPKPRLFRLTEDQAVINRFGFNNDGMEVIANRLARCRHSNRKVEIPVGLNLGANKDSEDRAADFAKVLAHCGNFIDFATVNVSSPNTEKLRDLQGPEALEALLAGVLDARKGLKKAVPVLLKIAPDLDTTELSEIAEVARKSGIDGVIATNTTLSRDGLKSAEKSEAGGLSGRPLFEKSTRVLAILSRELGEDVPLIGVGGIASPLDAYTKIRAGASLVQLYSAMVYQGLSLAPRIARGLDDLLAKDGFETVTEAVGTLRGDWL
ncbi:quinone-dependent dihydroorotate dehydrogenase [Celeribacter halophilus]|uniref:quinone-dependent dihydroorotate dehydrogenase n=1 Tax=Celeribacter halophilus TaxID=576117 RepID=UPI001C09448B|nr:quinone-dependent dihydroorotate dehydrogenase [Celeribacter halophilus]MBU2889229.1 quinone-dependent dihydroorotate dehydrogenase [Celeribacter halophilus]MDO6509533.1 quinone-dependent dihydroorotate dehydrogenase [Celeribacter halophilus]